MINLVFLVLNIAFAKNICVLNEYIDEASEIKTISCLENASSLIIMSPGGYADSGNRIIKVINDKKIRVVCLDCSSMAAFIWLNSDYRFLTKDSKFMIHYMSTNVNGLMSILLLRQKADQLEKDTHNYFNKIPQKDKELLLKNMKDKDFFFDHLYLKNNTSIKFQYVGET